MLALCGCRSTCIAPLALRLRGAQRPWLHALQPRKPWACFVPSRSTNPFTTTTLCALPLSAGTTSTSSFSMQREVCVQASAAAEQRSSRAKGLVHPAPAPRRALRLPARHVPCLLLASFTRKACDLLAWLHPGASPSRRPRCGPRAVTHHSGDTLDSRSPAGGATPQEVTRERPSRVSGPRARQAAAAAMTAAALNQHRCHTRLPADKSLIK